MLVVNTEKQGFYYIIRKIKAFHKIYSCNKGQYHAYCRNLPKDELKRIHEITFSPDFSGSLFVFGVSGTSNKLYFDADNIPHEKLFKYYFTELDPETQFITQNKFETKQAYFDRLVKIVNNPEILNKSNISTVTYENNNAYL